MPIEFKDKRTISKAEEGSMIIVGMILISFLIMLLLGQFLQAGHGNKTIPPAGVTNRQTSPGVCKPCPDFPLKGKENE